MEYASPDDRPEINTSDPRSSEHWLSMDLDDFDDLARRFPLAESPLIEVWTDNGSGPDWDFIGYGGLLGFLSEKLVFEFAKYSGECFHFLPCKVDKQPYFIPIRNKPVDCLNHAGSKYSVFKHDPSRIMHIKEFAFKSDRIHDPMAFFIPDTKSSGILVTSGVKQAIENIGCYGVEFKLLDTIE